MVFSRRSFVLGSGSILLLTTSGCGTSAEESTREEIAELPDPYAFELYMQLLDEFPEPETAMAVQLGNSDWGDGEHPDKLVMMSEFVFGSGADAKVAFDTYLHEGPWPSYGDQVEVAPIEGALVGGCVADSPGQANLFLLDSSHKQNRMLGIVAIETEVQVGTSDLQWMRDCTETVLSKRVGEGSLLPENEDLPKGYTFPDNKIVNILKARGSSSS